MGAAIALNLMQAGHSLTVFNRTREKTKDLEQAGASVAASAAQAATECNAVFSMLADDDAATEVVFGSEGIINALPATAVHVSLSTISVKLARRLASEHAAHNQSYVSATVFGRPDAAAARKLLVVAAGKASAIERVKSLLDAIGRQTFVAGSEPWQANLIKLNGNFMIAAMMETMGECFATMRKAGVDPHLFLEIVTELFGSPLYKNYGGSIVNEKFEPAAFALKLGLKDIRFGLAAADELNVPMPIASAVRDQFLAAMANGQEQMDWSSVAMVPALVAGLGKK